MTALALGTAQFGMRYGIANSTGRPSISVVRSILDRAESVGVLTLDTAYTYGDSEQILGRLLANRNPFRIITKTVPIRRLIVTKSADLDKLGFRDHVVKILNGIELPKNVNWQESSKRTVLAPKLRRCPRPPLLRATWDKCRGPLDGALLSSGEGRETLMRCDGAVGMASIMLYEAWLLARRVLSLQPNLHLEPLRALGRRDGTC